MTTWALRAFGRLAAEVRGVGVGEILGHGGSGERHNQGNGDQKLLHRGLSYLWWPWASKGPTGRPRGSIGMRFR